MKLQNDRDSKIEKLQIEKQDAINKFVLDIKNYGISFVATDGDLANVVFTKGKIVKKIAHEIFYRYSGRCVMMEINKKTGKEENIRMNDDNFYIWMKSLLLISFNIDRF